MDIPLKYAMVAWTRGKKVAIVRHPDMKDEMVRLGLDSDYGASTTRWRHLTTKGRLRELFGYGFVLALEEEIPMEQVHAAFSVIPEYRAAFKAIGVSP